MKTIHLYRNLTMVAVGMLNMLATSCEEDINNTASRNQSRLSWFLRVNISSSMRANPMKLLSL